MTNTPDPSEAMIEAVEQTISAWAFAHGIDGAARNDLFRRLRDELPPDWMRPGGARAMQSARIPAPSEDVEPLESWSAIRDDKDAIVRCGDRWKLVAEKIGCELHGFDDGQSASFITPDGSVIDVGPKFRAAIEALNATQPTKDRETDREALDDAAWLRNLANLRFNHEREDIADRLLDIANGIAARASSASQRG